MCVKCRMLQTTFIMYGSFCWQTCRTGRNVFHSEEHHKGLASCKTPKIFDHPLSSPPSTKRGIRAFLSQNKHPIVGRLGAAVPVSASDGPSISARKTIFDRIEAGDQRVTRSSWSLSQQLVGIYHMLEVRWPSGMARTLNKHIKMLLDR